MRIATAWTPALMQAIRRSMVFEGVVGEMESERLPQ